MSPKPKVLLFGASGQVGFEVVRNFTDYEVIPAVQEAQDGCIRLDIANLKDVAELIGNTEPDVIINAAAYTKVDQAEDEDESVVDRINSEAPGVMAESAAKLGAIFIHYSTDYVYPGEGSAPYTEESLTKPLSRYGASKLMGDEKVLALNANAFILRTSWVFGAHGHNFVKSMLRLGADREVLNIVDDQIGAPTSARTLALGARHIVEQCRTHDQGWINQKRGVYHLANSGETSWFGFAKEIFRLAPGYGYSLKLNSLNPISSSEFPTRATRPKNSRLSLEKIKGELGFQPKSWQLALKEDFFELPEPIGANLCDP